MPVKLAPGLTVDIQRTNGVIHSASITEVDWQGQSVTVEWSEQGDVKGKEVEFSALLQLNPDISTSLVGSTRTSTGASNNNSNFNSSRTSAHINNNNNHGINKMLPPPPPTGLRGGRAAAGGASSRQSTSLNCTTNLHNNSYLLKPTITNDNSTHGSKQSLVNNKRNSIRARATQIHSSSRPTMTASANADSEINTPAGPVTRASSIPTQQAATVASVTAAAAASAAAASNPARRKSHVIKNIDRITKQREERRTKAEAQKQEKIELMSNVEPGNPNWEFLGMIREYRDQLTYKPISANDEAVDHQICVALRKRPLNKREIQRKDVDVITVPSKNLTIVHEPKHKVDLTRYLENHMFRFDYAFDETATNDLVYRYTAKPLVHTIFEGGMSTCFAYGQTGSGKTHTMGGDFNGKTQDSTKGIYALVAGDVFKMLKSPKYRSENLLVYASFFEIYSGKVFDLLNEKAKLRVLEDANQQVQIVGLNEVAVETVDDVLSLINIGNNIRTSGQTSANNHSSRSHAVFQIILKHNRKQKNIKGKFSLIDLAGNERGADTSSANRQTRMEGAEINKSLLALKECIRALGRKGAHLPFRASKLTQVLRDSFIGQNSRTCMIAMISPGMQSCEHSLNTLRYADRVKELGTDGPQLKSEENGDEEMEAEDDLALLHNSNSAEISQDMHTFHEAISHLQDMEDEICEIHKNMVEHEDIEWNTKSKNLLDMTAQVDYDVDQYAQQLDDLIAQRLDSLTNLKEKVVNFRAQLREEELISQKMDINNMELKIF